MSTLTRYQNQQVAPLPSFGNLFALTNAFENLFEGPLAGFGEVSRLFGAWNPPVDIHEDKDSVYVKAELPGLKREEIEVSLENGQLSISGERKFSETHKDAHEHRSERFVGKFERVLSLPADVKADQVTAQYKDGILSITLPKAETAKLKQIEIKVD